MLNSEAYEEILGKIKTTIQQINVDQSYLNQWLKDVLQSLDLVV